MSISLNKNLLNVKNKNGKFESIDILTGPADDFLSSSSTNYVQNKVLKAEFDKKANIDQVPSIKVNNALNADMVSGHAVGLDIPTPETGAQDRFLRSDGTWVKISDIGGSGSGNAATLNGKSDSDFANAYNNFLVNYLSGQTGDIRALAYKLPMGNFVFNTGDSGLSGITFPWSGTGLMTWVPSKNDTPLIYYGMLIVRPLTTNGITYICSVYNTTLYTDWMSTADGGNAATVNGYTVASNVPANAVFTDTTYDLSPYLLTSNLLSTLSGMSITAQAYTATNPDGFRVAFGNYGFFIRNDNYNTYFMLTNSGDPFGSWNGLRPISISNSTGTVVMGNGLSIVNGFSASAGGSSLGVSSSSGTNVTGWFYANAGRSNTARSDYTTYQWRNTAASTSATPTSDATYGTAGSIYLQYS